MQKMKCLWIRPLRRSPLKCLKKSLKIFFLCCAASSQKSWALFELSVFCFVFWFKRVLDLDSQLYWSGQIQNIESLKRLYSVCWGGNKWPIRPLGVNYSVEVDGRHYWWPCGLSWRIWVIFLQKRRKIVGSKNSCLLVSNFCGRVWVICCSSVYP